jgi:type I restriction enzyme S subunit
MKLTPDLRRVDPRYLVHYFKSSHALAHLQNRTLATGVPHINLSILRRMPVPLLPLAEQRRIAKILDAAYELRAKRGRALEELDALVQSVFVDMFGDPVTNPKRWTIGVIGDLLESVTYGTSKKANPERGAYPILRMNNITYRGAWDFSELKYIDLSKKEATKHLVHKGQLLFNRTNSKELVGKTAVYRRDEPMAYAGYLVRGIANSDANPEFIGAFMNTPAMKKFLQNKCKSIIGMANINAKEFAAIPIAKPPVELQHRFATIVTTVEKQKAAQQRHLDELDALFGSLQSRAFKGGL